MAPRTRDAFSIAKMKEIFDDCSETLLAAIKRQNPDVNADQFDMSLRQLVMNFGNTSSMYPDMPGVLASIQTQTPIYSEAADLLIIARDEFKAGNTEESLKAFILSLEVPESSTLFEAMAHNNEQAKAAVIDNSIDAEPDLVTNNDENDDEDWENTPLYDITNPDEQLDNPDDIDADSEDVEAKIRLVAGQARVQGRHTPTNDEDEDNEDNESETDQENTDSDTDEEDSEEDSEEDDDSEDENSPMGGTSTTKVESKDRGREAFMLRVARNKISVTGTDRALERANSLKKAG